MGRCPGPRPRREPGRGWSGGRLREKLQTSNFKLQGNTKCQFPKTEEPFGVRRSESYLALFTDKLQAPMAPPRTGPSRRREERRAHIVSGQGRTWCGSALPMRDHRRLQHPAGSQGERSRYAGASAVQSCVGCGSSCQTHHLYGGVWGYPSGESSHSSWRPSAVMSR